MMCEPSLPLSFLLLFLQVLEELLKVPSLDLNVKTPLLNTPEELALKGAIGPWERKASMDKDVLMHRCCRCLQLLRDQAEQRFLSAYREMLCT